MEQDAKTHEELPEQQAAQAATPVNESAHAEAELADEELDAVDGGCHGRGTTKVTEKSRRIEF